VERSLQLMGRPMHRTASFIFVVSVILAPAAAVAQVQPGGTGGTVGKHDKSISGGAAPDEPGHSAREHKPHRPVAKPSDKAIRETRGSACGSIAGTWKWALGQTSVIKSNGSATNSNGATATWTCKEGQYIFVWSNGFTDHASRSTDRNHMDVVNNIGFKFSVARL
jgi:hypothetical protein